MNLKEKQSYLKEFIGSVLFKAITSRSAPWTNFTLVLLRKILNSYHPAGVILWLNRPRSLLKDKTPAEIIISARKISEARIILKLAEDLEYASDIFPFWKYDETVINKSMPANTPWLQAC